MSPKIQIHGAGVFLTKKLKILTNEILRSISPQFQIWIHPDTHKYTWDLENSAFLSSLNILINHV